MSKVALFLVGLCLVLPPSPQTTAPAGTIKIGTFLSLTGSTAAYGVSASNAIKLATDEVNRSGFDGVTGKITLDANRNAQVPVYMLRIAKGGKFTLQQSIPDVSKQKSRSRSK